MQKKQYNFKDAFIILKKVADNALAIYKSKSDMIVRQLENAENNQYKSDSYGLLHLKSNSAKTAKVYTAKEQKQVDELQAQIDELQAQIDKLGKTIIIADSYNSLVCKANSNADAEANELLADLITTIGNATMVRASKTMRQ